MASLANLMDPAPRPWGLRGDPHLFEAMKRVFADHPVPQTQEQLRTAFLAAFETLTDVALDGAPDHISVTWTRKNNGGMSNGLIARSYWQDQMLPALLDRLSAVQHAEN